MFGDDTTHRLLAVQNEQRAQKASSAFNGGSLNLPSTAPQQEWSGRVSNPGLNDIAARWVATFTRTDSINLPPMVDFAWNIDLDLWHWQDEIAAGFYTGTTGRDKTAGDHNMFSSAPYGSGDNFVSWSIDILGAGMGGFFYNTSDGTIARLTVQAISMVAGTLTLARVI